MLANLCCSNLLSAVLVKSISVVHHGYAVAQRVTQSGVCPSITATACGTDCIAGIAFCTLYTLGHRATAAVLPWSVALLSWLRLHHRIQHIRVGLYCGDHTISASVLALGL